MDTAYDYDAIVIGSGLGGLSMAVALIKNNYKVLVIEKNHNPGGNCVCFTKNGYRFDYALHQLNGIGNRQSISNLILEEYEVEQNLHFRQVDPFMTIVFNEEEYNLSSDWNNLHKDLINYFPSNEKEIRKFFKKTLRDIHDISVIQRLMYGRNKIIRRVVRHIPLKTKIFSLFRIPFVFAQTGKTGDEYLRHRISNDRLWSLITASWPYLGLPPSRVAGLMLGGFIATEHSEKTYYPIGGSQKITDALMTVIHQKGEIKYGNGVAKIIVEKESAVGVELNDGSKFFAKRIISNADLIHTCSLVEKCNSSLKQSNSVQNLIPSIGPFRIFLGFDVDIHQLGMPNFEYLFYSTDDHNEVYDGMCSGYQKVISAYSPSGIDPTAAPAGHSTLVLLTMFKWETSGRDWRTHKETIAQEMIDVIEKRIPGIRQHIRVMEIMTPADIHQKTNTHKGSMYGWELSPEQSILKRVNPKTPVKNLYLSGHWTQPGPGMTTAIISGWMGSKHVMKGMKGRPDQIMKG